MNSSNLTNSMIQPIRIFIGSSAKNFIEERVFIYTIQKYSSLPVEVNIINGDTGSVTLHTGEVKKLPLKVRDRIKMATNFSLARYAIPEWCGYQGRAIYCDSDQVVLTDIAELWNYDLADNAVAAVHVRAAESGQYYINTSLKNLIDSDDNYYLTSVMLMDCSRLQYWDIETIFEQLDRQEYFYPDLMFLGKIFTNLSSIKVGVLPSYWNHLDVLQEDSKLVHFTDLSCQPWLFPHNPVGAFWEKIFLESVDQGFLSQKNILQAYQQGFISSRIKALPFLKDGVRQPLNNLWRTWDHLVFFLQSLPQLIGRQLLSLKSSLRKWIKVAKTNLKDNLVLSK